MALSLVPTTPNAPTQVDAPKRTGKSGKPGKPKTNAKHKGVQILNARSKNGALSLRWVDLETRRERTELLPGVTTRKDARESAILKSQKLVADKRAFVEVGRCAVREIATECKSFLDEATKAPRKGPNVGKRLAPNTVARYRVALNDFASWCVSQGLTTLRDLTAAKLSDWRTSRLEHTMSSGELRNVSTVNFEMKPVRAMLTLAHAAGRFDSLTDVKIRAALARFSEAKPAPVCLTVAKIRALLRAVTERDAARPIKHAPAFALALLGGMRRGEVAALTVGQVAFDEPTEYDPTITHAVVHGVGTKTAPREVDVLPYSPLLLDLLHALADDRKPDDALQGADYEQLGAESTALAELGGGLDGFVFKTLRSTCASYQGPIPGNDKAKADRLGHTLAVAAKYYLAVSKGTPLVAASLDAIMQCEPELRAIIAAVTRQRAPRASRAARRAE